MIGVNTYELDQLEILKSAILQLPKGIAAYPRELLSQPISPRVVRRLIEEIRLGIEEQIKALEPKQDVWSFYWD